MMKPIDSVIYENTHYQLVIGHPPLTKDMPRDYVCYLYINKETGVVEGSETVLFYAKQWVDHFSEMLSGNKLEDAGPPTQGGLFN